MSPFLVGIGASAGGLEALRTFFSAMPADSDLSFVVVQHLAPDFKSLMAELLARLTPMPVLRAEEGMQVQPNHIYLIPPRYNLSITDGILHLSSPPADGTLNLPIDIFFRSLAQSYGERAIAIILSGTGSDGARGIRAIKESGGMVMVQAEASAKFAGMPASAIATGTADFVLPVEEMPDQLVNFLKHPFAMSNGHAPHIAEDSGQLARVAQRLRDVSGIDFAHYKPATFVRRIERRMNISHLRDIEEYIAFLNENRTEAETLGKDLLISVTKFFRDPEAFAELEKEIERLFERAGPDKTVRVWSAGCATGEEAYSLAMLCDKIREEKFPSTDLKIFATDVDRRALEIAGNGVYPASIVADLPPEMFSRYFIPEGRDHFRVVRSLRDRLIFARQDLMADPPFTRLDLVSCRNLLIYLQPPAQHRALSLLHFSLLSEGTLLLGGSETVGSLAYAFKPVSNRYRIYRKNPGVVLRMADAVSTTGDSLAWSSVRAEAGGLRAKSPKRYELSDAVRQRLLDRFVPATVVVSPQFHVLFSMGPVSDYLSLPSGPARFELLKMVPRDLALAISTASAQASRENRAIEFRSVRFARKPDDPTLMVRVSVEPFQSFSKEGEVLIIVIQPEANGNGLDPASEDFDFDQQLLDRNTVLERELQSTRENLQSSIEQQETVNEELQAANEELLASNEELQSTNEELESVNEELYTVNAEFQEKIQELTRLADDMENFAESSRIGAIFFDREMRIRRFTSVFGAVTGLEDPDVGRHIDTFAHPMLSRVRSAAPEVLETGRPSEIVIEAGDGKEYLLRIQPYVQEKSELQGVVATLINVDRLRDFERKLYAILDTVDVGICVTDERGRFDQVNRAYSVIYGYEPHELIGRHFTMVVPPEMRDVASKMHDDFMESGEEIPAEWDVVGRNGRAIRVSVRASLLKNADGQRYKITVVTDLTRVGDRARKQILHSPEE